MSRIIRGQILQLKQQEYVTAAGALGADVYKRQVRDCVSVIKEQRGIRINVMSLSYNRLMNHVKYMVARVLKGESLKVNMNDYVQRNFPDAFELATTVCDHLSHA